MAFVVLVLIVSGFAAEHNVQSHIEIAIIDLAFKFLCQGTSGKEYYSSMFGKVFLARCHQFLLGFGRIVLQRKIHNVSQHWALGFVLVCCLESCDGP